ncbi:unnamed protein product [Blumeria hordei]|uniref:F-box domain-containing protein n=1 Tax=Blumeria hordei TaxID=2867405 RepID=A0A383URP0_BLUHO|nr:unnamed protein product [Blumeria hordei]
MSEVESQEATKSIEPNISPGDLNISLEVLYQKLQDLELIEQKVFGCVDNSHGRTFLQNLETQNDDTDGQKTSQTNSSDTLLHKAGRDKIRILKNMIDNIDILRGMIRDKTKVIARSHIRQLNILDLPDELLIRICEEVQGREECHIKYIPDANIGIQEVKNLRLTCWKFCNVSSHLLISCVHVDLEANSIAHLDEVSRHPTIAKGVEVIQINMLYYDSVLEEDVETFGDFHARQLHDVTECVEDMASHDVDLFTGTPSEVVNSAIQKGWAIGNAWFDYVNDDSENKPTDESVGYQKILLAAYEQYRQKYAAQEKLLKSGDLPRVVAAAMARMHNATRLDLHNSEFTRRYRRPDYLTMINNEESLIKSTLFPITWEKGMRFELGNPPLELLFQLPAAIYEAGVFLSTLEIRAPPCDFLSLASNKESLQKVKHATQRLRNFSYDPRVSYCSGLWSAEESNEIEALGEYLNAHLQSPLLEDIRLSCDFLQIDAVAPWFNLGVVLTRNHWPRLKIISLTGLAFHFSELEMFINQVQKPLTVWFRRLHLLSGTWSKVLDILRGKVGSYPTIEDLSGGEFDEMSDEEKQDILGKAKVGWDMNKVELYVLSIYGPPNPFKKNS